MSDSLVEIARSNRAATCIQMIRDQNELRLTQMQIREVAFAAVECMTSESLRAHLKAVDRELSSRAAETANATPR